MATLSAAKRAELWGEWQRDNVATLGALTKADLRAAVDALDVYLDTNASVINLAIPLPARTALTATQKARLLMHVIRKRFVEGS